GLCCSSKTWETQKFFPLRSLQIQLLFRQRLEEGPHSSTRIFHWRHPLGGAGQRMRRKTETRPLLQRSKLFTAELTFKIPSRDLKMELKPASVPSDTLST